MDIKSAAIGIIVLGVLLAGLAGGVYLSQRQTQLESQAACDGTVVYAKNTSTGQCGEFFDVCAPPAGWARDASCNSSNSSPVNPSGPPPPPGGTDTCSTSCGVCPSKVDKCGNTVYQGTCDYSTCTGPGATYRCTSSSNNNCNGVYECGISCIGTPNDPAQPPPPPAGGAPGQATDLTCGGVTFKVNGSPANFANVGDTITVEAGASSNQNIDMSRVIVGFRETGTATFTNIGNGIDCSGNNPVCNGQVVWNTSGLNAGEYTIALSPINAAGTQRNPNGTDSSCNITYTLASASTTNPPQGGDAGVPTDLTCSAVTFEVNGAPANFARVGDAITVRAGASSNQNINMSRIIVSVKETASSGGFSNIGTINCIHNNPNCTGVVTWNPLSSWNPGEYLIALSPINASGTQRNPDGTDSSCNITYSLVSRGTTPPPPPGGNPPPPGPNPPPPPPGVSGISTLCYFLSEQPFQVGNPANCQQPNARLYLPNTKIAYTFEPPTQGIKTIFVRFISNRGDIQDFQKTIDYTAKPVISNANCRFAPTGEGTNITITGSGFGTTRGNGILQLQGRNVEEILSWTDSLILAKLPSKLEGQHPVKVKTNRGLESDENFCRVNITTVEFSAQLQCSATNFSASDVVVEVFENVPSSDPRRPLYRQTIKLDPRGRPQLDFSPKFEVGRTYVVRVKAPNSLAETFTFTATEGNTVIANPILLLAGNIFPAGTPDRKINAFDQSALIREWSPAKDKESLADFDKNERVNTFDYACIRDNIKQDKEDKDFIPPRVLIAPPPPATGPAQPAAQ